MFCDDIALYIMESLISIEDVLEFSSTCKNYRDLLPYYNPNDIITVTTNEKLEHVVKLIPKCKLYYYSSHLPSKFVKNIDTFHLYNIKDDIGRINLLHVTKIILSNCTVNDKLFEDIRNAKRVKSIRILNCVNNLSNKLILPNTLEELHIECDIDCFEDNLSNLKKLTIISPIVNNIKPFYKCKNLEYLDISSTSIENIREFDFKNLKELNIRNTNIETSTLPSLVKKLGIRRISMSYTNPNDLIDLMKIRSLNFLIK